MVRRPRERIFLYYYFFREIVYYVFHRVYLSFLFNCIFSLWYCDDYVILVSYVLIILIGFLIILIVIIKFFYHYTVPILTTKDYVAHV